MAQHPALQWWTRKHRSDLSGYLLTVVGSVVNPPKKTKLLLVLTCCCMGCHFGFAHKAGLSLKQTACTCPAGACQCDKISKRHTQNASALSIHSEMPNSKSQELPRGSFVQKSLMHHGNLDDLQHDPLNQNDCHAKAPTFAHKCLSLFPCFLPGFWTLSARHQSCFEHPGIILKLLSTMEIEQNSPAKHDIKKHRPPYRKCILSWKNPFFA